MVQEPQRSAPEHREILHRMRDALRLRGPDEAGGWQSADNCVHLGHRRLSILDLTPSGAQPMRSPDGRRTIVFNGEIYNFRILRAQLEQRGARFVGKSDTEVLLHALGEWGEVETLRRLDGMFAFAVWDAQESTLTLARDRIGEKPLYYAATARGILFSSELKALRQHPEFDRRIDRVALAHYVRHGYVPGPLAIYQGCRKLQPGQFLVYRLGGGLSEPTPYWSASNLLETRDVETRSADDPLLVDELEDLLRRSVGERMVADVPLGALLSGGIDSSLIVALMQAQSGRPVKTFTIGFGDSPFDEAPYAKQVARHLGTEHHEHQVTAEETLALVTELPGIYDEPFADSSQVPTTLVSRFTRRHVTVALSGDAGDELFCGYNRYLWSARVWPRLARLPLVLRAGLAQAIMAGRPATWTKFADFMAPVLPSRLRVRGAGDKLHKLARAAWARSPEELYVQLATMWPDPGMIVLGAGLPPATSEFHLLPGEMPFVQRMMFHDLTTCLPDDMLCKVDRAAMSASLEVRVPFLANELVRFAWRVPAATHMQGGVGKRLLRNVLARHVPRELFERPKAGFGVPIRDWLRGPLREWAAELLAADRLKRDGFFASGPIQEAWTEHQSGRRSNQHQLWSVLMFQSWLDANR
ncbi:MAG: asparagine synthase (glutamine-hydrolyzing) [Candidatus Didemnitutus sp.]|nr:asparagine synthase (glutamine-hydrolyzing) [Candidatus Didemnitutus sp.]